MAFKQPTDRFGNEGTAADLISSDAGNSLISGTDGKLYNAATAVVNDDQILTGDNTTNVTVTLTAATVPDGAGGDQVNYTIKAVTKVDGTTITEDPTTHVLSAADQTLNVLPTVQPTPTATGNTTNLNSTFKDASGTTWIVDKNGDAIMAGAAVFKELKQVHVDKNGNDTTGTGADENPVLTVTKALSLAGQADAVVVTEGTYAETVTMSVQNVTLRGEGSEYGGLTEINALNVTTASGTSNRVSSLTVSGNVAHTGGAPLYLSDVTINGNYASSSTAYTEIRGSRIQSGTISKTAAGTLYITNSLIGNATFSTANSTIALDNVTIDAGKTLTIGAGVIYSLNDVRGHVVYDPAAIPAETAALAGGLTGLAAKSVETATFNDIRLINVPTITTATMMLVRDADGVVSELSLAGFDPSVVVYVDAATPATATIFDLANPPETNDDALKNRSDALYIGTDGSVWIWNGAAYVTKTYSFPTRKVQAFTATADQRVYTLQKTPVGDISMFRNGIHILPGAILTVGATVNYNPQNSQGGLALGTVAANDRIVIVYEAY